MTLVLALLLTTCLGLLGGGSAAGDGPDGEQTGRAAHHIGRPVVSWDQARFPDILTNPELGPGPRVIATDAERDRLLESKPLGPDLSEVAAVDLDQNVLVVAGYFRCAEVGAVSTDGDVIWFETLEPEPERQCAWSPYTVQIFEVPRSAFGDDLTLGTPPPVVRHGEDQPTAPVGRAPRG